MTALRSTQGGAQEPVYVIAQLTISDRARYGKYARAFAGVLGKFGGQLLAADVAPRLLEGTWDREKVILIQFESEAAFTRWAESDDYRTISRDRVASTQGPVLLVRGTTGLVPR
jgi:uncharacterized protein (DUF1330 family)